MRAPVNADPKRRTLLRWGVSAAFGGFVFGYQLAVISGALLFVRRDFSLGGFEQGVLVGVLPLGAIAGGLLAGRLADSLGRRRTLIVIALTFIAGTVLSAVAPGYGVLVLARGIVGVAVGAVSSTVPLYLSEIAPPGVRGRLVTMNQLAVTLGIVAAYCVGLAFAGSESWRAMFAVGLVPAAALLAAMLRAPETPAWLDAHGQTEQAREVARQVVDEDEVERVIDGIRQLREQEAKRVGVRDLTRSGAAPALAIGVTLAAAQQLAGINAVIAYAPTIMEKTGLTASNSILYSVIVGAINVAATVVAIRLVDHAGRRALLLASSAASGASLALLGMTFELSLGDAGSWLSLICIVAYVAAFALGLGPIFWLLIAEIFPPEARAAGASVSTAVNWFTSFVVGVAFLPIADVIGQGPTFWIFAAVCAFAFAFVDRYVPETRGRTFSEIDADVRQRWSRRTVSLG